MYTLRLFIPGFVACALLVAGCSQPEPVTPQTVPTETSPAVGEEGPAASPTAEATSAPAPEAAPAAEPTPEVGAPAEAPLPEVRAVNTAELGEIMEKTRGKVTVLNFWATWCVPCVKEMPDFVTLYNESDPELVALVSLSIDDASEVAGAIPEFQRTHKMPFPIYVLNERDDEALEKALRGKFSGMIPATFVYDKTGALVKMVEGPVTLAELREILKPLLTPAS